MHNYQNTNRRGVRSSVTIVPKALVEDIDRSIHTLSPYAIPLQMMANYIGRGRKPHSHKIQVQQFHEFDNFDNCSSVVLGTSNETRFARLTLDQLGRPGYRTGMLYYPQDKFYIAQTDQTVEVVMTPDAAMQLTSGQDITLSTTLTGSTASRSAEGTVVVRSVLPIAMKEFTTSPAVFMGRTIRESQDIEAYPVQRDFVYDCNFVEHKEKVITFTEDQKNMIQTYGKTPDWNMQQREMIKEFKVDVEFTALFGERQDDFSNSPRPTRHMNGCLSTIKTNVATYDPYNFTDFELMLLNFFFDMSFRYNPNGTNKMAMCGGNFLKNFNIAFREYRRTQSLDIGKKIKLNADTYIIPGNFQLMMTRCEAFRQGTYLENWCSVMDPSLAEWRLVKDYNSRMYQNNNERDFKLMIEWQGSIAWHLEQAHSFLRTYK